MAKARADLVSDALSNLGIVILADGAATRTRAELATEAFGNLGFNTQADASATRTRADWVNETLRLCGVIQQADASAVRNRADWVNETLAMLGVIQQADASAARTRDQLVNNVAFILGPGEVGNALNADDYAAIDARFDTVIGDLNARAIATIANPNAIPGAWFDAVSVIVANVAKEYYGVTGEEAQKLQAEAVLAEKKLKTLTRTGLVDEILPQLLGELNARGVATVTNIAAIPGAWLPALADIAAEYVKGKFEIDPARSQEIALRAKEAEQKLRTLSAPSYVDSILPSLVGELNARAIANVTNIAAIPGAWFPSLADIAAEYVKGRVGVAPERSMELAARAQAAERKLKAITQAPLIDEKIPSIVGELNARGIVTIANLEAIPGAYFSGLADIVAESCRGKFEVAPDIAVRVAARAQAAERTLKNLTRSFLVDRNLDSILATLAAQNIVYLVDQSDIPDEWYFSLAAIVADRCKGKFELDPMTLQRVTTDGAQAVLDLRELTRGRPSYLPQQTSCF